jgi:hypothetical protein
MIAALSSSCTLRWNQSVNTYSARRNALVEKYTRQSTDQWLLTSASKLAETIHLQSIDFGLRLADLYEKVELAEAPVIPTRLHS